MSSSAPAPPQRSRSRGKAFLVLLLLLAAVATAGGLWYRSLDRVSTDDATVDGHIAEIAPKITGSVAEVLVNDNQPVKAGDVLVRIDPRDFQARVELAKATLLESENRRRSAQAVVPWTNDTTQSGVSAAQAHVADARAEVDRARIAAEQAAGSDLAFAEANIRARQAANDRAQADLARIRPLAEKSEISRLQLDAYVAGARVAESELEAAQERLASARKEAEIRRAAVAAAESRLERAAAEVRNADANRKQVPIRTSDVGTAEAAVAAARASLEAAQLQLGYTTITAPMDGVVTRKGVEVGNIVSPGQSLMAIIPLHDVWVTANFKETDLAGVRSGQPAEIKVDMYRRKVSGRVDSIAGATGSRLSLLPPENASGNFVKVVQRIPVKILVNDAGGLVLRPGMNVEATIITR